MHLPDMNLAISLMAVAALLLIPSEASAQDQLATCVAPSQWIQLTDTGSRVRRTDGLLAELARSRIVLLGESHDSAEHHRWQLHTIAALYALKPDLVLGFEMFPRRVQPVLDLWSAGKLTQDQLLARTEWSKVWGHDPQLYLPLFHFARMHRIPMVALNVDRSLVSRVAKEGWNAVPPAERDGLSDPAPPDPAYLKGLFDSYLEHQPSSGTTARRAPGDAELGSPEFRRFVESMQVWDRAMAQALAERVHDPAHPLVVGIMGSGHVRHGYGVPHQLRDLGISDAAVLLPWDATDDCATLATGLADAVFGLDTSVVASASQPPRLGILMDESAEGIKVREVLQHSIAEVCGLKAGDVITTIAGVPARDSSVVVGAVRRQAPGTWLPITVMRAGQVLELVARFPAAQ